MQTEPGSAHLWQQRLAMRRDQAEAIIDLFGTFANKVKEKVLSCRWDSELQEKHKFILAYERIKPKTVRRKCWEWLCGGSSMTSSETESCSS